MKILAKLGLILLLAVNFFTFGCAVKRITTVTQPLTSKLSNYDCLKIEQFTYSQTFKEAKIKDADDEMQANRLRDMFQERVRHQIFILDLFKKVEETECPDGVDNIVLLKGEITYMKRVTKATRLLTGAMGGRARVDVDILLVDPQTDDVIGAASFKGTSTGGSVLAGGTEEAFDNTAQLIAKFIKNSY